MLFTIATILLCTMPLSTFGAIYLLNKHPTFVKPRHMWLSRGLMVWTLAALVALGVSVWEVSQIAENLFRL